MSTDQIPPYLEAQPGQVVRSQDWNAMQRSARNSIRTHRHNRTATDDAAVDDNALQIRTDEIADGAVTEAKLADNAVTSAKIADGTIQMADLAPVLQTAIGSAGQLADGAVTEAKLANNAVTSAKIADASVGAAKLAEGAVTSAKIKDGTIAWNDLSSDVQDRVTSGGGLADGAVTTVKIKDGAVEEAKLADSAVTSTKIKDDTIQLTDLAPAVREAIIGAQRVTYGVIRLDPQESREIKHGLGEVPVGIQWGVIREDAIGRYVVSYDRTEGGIVVKQLAIGVGNDFRWHDTITIKNQTTGYVLTIIWWAFTGIQVET